MQKKTFALLLLSIAALSFGGCKSETKSYNPLGLLGSANPVYDTYYVDVTAGSDTNSGGSATKAFKTITNAVAKAGIGKTIMVAPGQYTVGSGETFPITLMEGQSLIGDIANRGQGTTGTEIICTNTTAGSLTAENSCLSLANNTTVRGFAFNNSVYQNAVSGVFGGAGLTAVASDNTFNGNLHTGLYFISGNLTSENNVFNVVSYSYYLQDLSSSTSLINDNIINEFSALPINIGNASSAVSITNNTITGSGQVGIQVFNGDPLIQGNTFNRTAGYTYGAIYCQFGTASPKIRSNTFSCANGIRINGSDILPDIGSSTEAGGNNFTAITTYAIQVDAVSGTNVYAIGNTWPSSHNPPTATDIDINVTGVNVWYGTGGTDCITGL